MVVPTVQSPTGRIEEHVLDKITWPIVALVGLILAAVTVMGVAHADTRVIIDVILALGLGGGLGVLSSIKTNVNGNLSQLVRLMGDAMERLAKSHPPPEE